MKHFLYRATRSGSGWVVDVIDPTTGKQSFTKHTYPNLNEVKKALDERHPHMVLVSNRYDGQGWKMLYEEVE